MRETRLRTTNPCLGQVPSKHMEERQPTLVQHAMRTVLNQAYFAFTAPTEPARQPLGAQVPLPRATHRQVATSSSASAFASYQQSLDYLKRLPRGQCP